MNRARKRGAVVGLVGALVAAAGFVAFGLTTTSAVADTTEPSLISFRNASDPDIHSCSDNASRWSGLCLYASNDLGTDGPWHYPMDKTYLYTVDSGLDPSVPGNWRDRGVVLNENQYPWVPAGSKHLWAPAHMAYKDTNYLLVPDVTDISLPSDTSQIGISTSTSPFGPFTYVKNYAITGYASDPAFLDDPISGKPYLIYADGDNGNCGGISIAELDSNDVTTIVGAPMELPIAGTGDAFGLSSACQAKGQPYLEGAALYYYADSMTGATSPGGGQYYLVLAVKPEGGTYGASNEVIAYATAPAVTGPYTYQGVIMSGSNTEWTNQASIARFADRFILAYHDGTPTPACGTAPGTVCPQRKVRAACLNFHAGVIMPIKRGPNVFDRCWEVNGPIALRSRGASALVTAADGGADDLEATRTVLDTWEKFDLRYESNGNFTLRARANGKYVSSNHGLGVLRADVTTPGLTEQFSFQFNDDGSVRLRNYLGNYVAPTNLDFLADSTTPRTEFKSPEFDVIQLSGTYAMWSLANFKYVAAEQRDGSNKNKLMANRSAIGAWEKFDLIDQSDGTVAFRAQANSKYVVAEQQGGADKDKLLANRDAIGPWEKFYLIFNVDGSASLRSAANSRYVVAEQQSGADKDRLIANRTVIGPWEKFGLMRL